MSVDSMTPNCRSGRTPTNYSSAGLFSFFLGTNLDINPFEQDWKLVDVSTISTSLAPRPLPFFLGGAEGLERLVLISCLYGSAKNSGATNQIAVLGL